MSPGLPPPPSERIAHAFELALAQALLAEQADEVPVGAAILGPDGEVLALARNEIEGLSDPTAHAERLALTRACAAVGAPRLPEGSLLVATLEPCAMCAGAIVLARVRFLAFGATDPKTGACGSLRDIVRDTRLNHRVELLPCQQVDACAALLTRFFRARRPGAATGLSGDGPIP